jgi:transmembrane sensor
MDAPAERKEGASLEAARWLVALDEAPDDTDLRVRFQTWLDSSPANSVAWADACDVYGMLQKAQPMHRAAWGSEAVSRSTLRLRTWRLAFAGSAAAIAVCLAMVSGPGLLLRLQADHATSTAEIRSLDLEDGSIVRLAPDSAIDLVDGAGGRRVRLLQGEAFFEVKPDPARPFRVTAREIETTVLGTSFSVGVAGDGVEVAVRSGLVRVDGAPGELGPGQWVRVSTRGKPVRGAIPSDEVAPWLQRQLVARDRRMAEVIDELRRSWAGAIVVADGSLGDRRVTGVYNLSDPAAALRAIVGTHGGSVRQVSPWLLIAY